MNDEVLRHFFGGFVRMHILYHAAKEPIWGVEMMEELRRHGYRLGPGTLYPILHHLEAAGFLTSKTDVVSGKRRKNYQITRAGRKLLQNARKKLRELVSEILEDRDGMHQEKGGKR
jgi:PadR family transcriptional regulator, regulatory protein PadR